MSESTKPAVDPLLSGDSGEAAAVPSYSLDDDSDDDDDEDYNKLKHLDKISSSRHQQLFFMTGSAVYLALLEHYRCKLVV
jgi:hypothetical protein